MQGISWLAENLLAPQEGICSMELVRWHCLSIVSANAVGVYESVFIIVDELNA
jgi:hypothetical protein